MNWERSPDYGDFWGCRLCLQWRGNRRAAYPDRIPILIVSGEVDHLLPRPEQVGDVVFEPIDIDIWRETGRRVPAAPKRLAPSPA
ncbi:MAG: hypothetical protein H0V51_22495 [Chloroflexi bacterium]|nr:hypothetical protein [Chloroflexota bacterium]